MVRDKDPITRVSEPVRFKPRKRSFLRGVIRMFGFILLIGAILLGAFAWAGYILSATGPLVAKKIVQIPKTADRVAIATQLQQEGVISGTRLFSAAALVDEQLRHAHLKTGEYDFPANASMAVVLSMLGRGDVVKYKVTIPEGWTSQMAVNRLNEQEELDGQVSATPAEGTLLPETYIVTRGYTRDKLLADMAAAQNKILESVAAQIPPGSPVKTKEDVITLASIVEKETGVATERPEVAAVFLNRLKQHMRLQSDPTVIYGIVAGAGKLDRPITRDDLDRETPYNTYVIDGLPPGPIANPGKAAIEAVLNPANVPYLYFVANGAGGHAFASTLEEHNANVKKWRSLNGSVDPAPSAKPASAAPVVAPLPGTLAPPDATPPATPAPVVKPKKKLKNPPLP
ncbi:MAG: endolytic transglycosylase MltG [Pseudomonadota bacterium]|nr:endolytic transglycosylase MltG [Pseudomonadota bacterium]